VRTEQPIDTRLTIFDFNAEVGAQREALQQTRIQPSQMRLRIDDELDWRRCWVRRRADRVGLTPTRHEEKW
jgi:hypothetical protein